MEQSSKIVVQRLLALENATLQNSRYPANLTGLFQGSWARKGAVRRPTFAPEAEDNLTVVAKLNREAVNEDAHVVLQRRPVGKLSLHLRSKPTNSPVVAIISGTLAVIDGDKPTPRDISVDVFGLYLRTSGHLTLFSASHGYGDSLDVYL